MNTRVNCRFLLVIGFIFFCSTLSAELFNPSVLYLTWQRNPESTMTITWITNQERPFDEVDYQKKGDNSWYIARGMHQQMPNGYPYYIHRVELTQLQPATEYFFRIGIDGVIFKFRTMSADLESPIRFVAGGDVYHDDIKSVGEINRQAAKTNPDFAIIGGDLAYSLTNMGFLQKFISRETPHRWLTWLAGWKAEMVASDGRLIPLIPAIGNHETMGGEGQTPEQAKFFYALFTMPGKQGYNVLDFSDYLSLILLDSGHTHDIGGEQTRWLNTILSQRQQKLHKFALYHEGAYPSVRSPDGKIPRTIRKHWVPLFERYGLSAAFENHDHAYKRTFILKNGRIDSSGVLYLGDGCWGVKSPRIPKKQKYIAESASTRHFILVTLDKESRRYTAIGPQGNIIDEFIHPINPIPTYR